MKSEVVVGAAAGIPVFGTLEVLVRTEPGHNQVVATRFTGHRRECERVGWGGRWSRLLRVQEALWDS